jgi:hypothetical protein
VNLAVIVSAPLILGCAQLQIPAARELKLLQSKAQGPGTLFGCIEAAAVDALTYAYQQARAARFGERTAELMRGGTIYATPGGYSYGEIHVAKSRRAQQVTYTLEPQDVARFLIYPRVHDRRIDRANERPSPEDRYSVNEIDPLGRPIYILHPSLMIREYRGEDRGLREVAQLLNSTRTMCPLAAGFRHLRDDSC